MDCLKWFENKTVNPRTGRKIKEGGSTYKELERECAKVGESDKAEKCAMWRRNPLKNPETGRSIKRGGPIYRRWQKACEDEGMGGRRAEFRKRTSKAREDMYKRYSKSIRDITNHTERCNAISRHYHREVSKSSCRQRASPKLLTKRILQIVKEELKGPRVKREGVIKFILHMCPEFKDEDQRLDALKSIANNLADIFILGNFDYSDCIAGLENKKKQTRQLYHQYLLLERMPVYGALLLKTFESVRRDIRKRNAFFTLERRLLRLNQKTYAKNRIIKANFPWSMFALEHKREFSAWMKGEGAVTVAHFLLIRLAQLSAILNTIFPKSVAKIEHLQIFDIPAIWDFGHRAVEFLPWVLGITDTKPSILSESDMEMNEFARSYNIHMIKLISSWMRSPNEPSTIAISVQLRRPRKVGHANVIIINKRTRTLIHFEPHDKKEGSFLNIIELFRFLAHHLGLRFVETRGNYALQQNLPWCTAWCYYFAAVVAFTQTTDFDVKEIMSFSGILRFLFFLHHQLTVKREQMYRITGTMSMPRIPKEDYLRYRKRLQMENIVGKHLLTDKDLMSLFE